VSHRNLLSAIPLSIYGLLGVASKMLDIFSHPFGGLLFGRETDAASEVWVRQMTKRAEPIVETGQAAFDCHGQPSQLVVSACQSAFRPRRRSTCCTVDRWESRSVRSSASSHSSGPRCGTPSC